MAAVTSCLLHEPLACTHLSFRALEEVAATGFLSRDNECDVARKLCSILRLRSVTGINHCLVTILAKLQKWQKVNPAEALEAFEIVLRANERSDAKTTSLALLAITLPLSTSVGDPEATRTAGSIAKCLHAVS